MAIPRCTICHETMRQDPLVEVWKCSGGHYILYEDWRKGRYLIRDDKTDEVVGQRGQDASETSARPALSDDPRTRIRRG